MNTKKWIERYKKPEKEFIAGKTYIPVASQVIDQQEIENLIDVAFSEKYTEGKWCNQFSRNLSKLTGKSHITLVNSGSSADLVGISTFMETNPQKKLVVTPATNFPTTVNPIFQNGGEVRFIDVDPLTLNAVPWQVMSSLEDEAVGGIALAHTLGFPFDEKLVMSKCEEKGKWLLVDTCDALGGTLNNIPLGTYSHGNTYSFYPAHQMMTAEGGAFCTNDSEIHKIAESYSNWGRDCNCPPGCDNTCGKRFQQKMGNLPYGYDHKYIYARLGYNLKMTEFQGALGCAQSEKIVNFSQKRRESYQYLRDSLAPLEEYLQFVEILDGANPSPFGFPISVRPNKYMPRANFVRYLEDHKIGTRMVFGGNLTKQPAYMQIKNRWHTCWPLTGTDYIMNNTLWIGVHPALTQGMLDYMVTTIHEFFE